MDKQEHPTTANFDRWNKLAQFHLKAAEAGIAGPIYDLEGLRGGKTSLFPIELKELPNLKGKKLLHLQCHFGMDSISLARMGAEVVGIDYSEVAIKAATNLAEELGENAIFIQSDIYDLPSAIADQKESFDFVFTSHGVLCWLSDIKAWGKIISYFLKPGGQFYVIDSHPFAGIFDNEEQVTDFKPVIPYFNDGRSFRFESEGSYLDEDASNNHSLDSTASYEWFHSLSDIVMSLIDADLTIVFLHEHQESAWRSLPFATRLENGLWVVEKDGVNIPLSFSVLAKKSPHVG